MVFPDRSRNCGFFRYWTLSNAPLFLLAAPVTFIMLASARWAAKHSMVVSAINASEEEAGAITWWDRQQVIRNLAISQVVLTVLTLTTAHVQIITRISSAYPVWVWYLAMLNKGEASLGGTFVRFMVIYEVIQAGLFASFLPPA